MGGRGHTIAQSICTRYSCFEKYGWVCDSEKKSGPYFGLDIFQVPDPKKVSSRPDKLEKWVQIDWTNM